MTEPLEQVITPHHLEYTYSAGQAASKFLRAVARGRIVGQRCPRCSNVYVPPRGSCALCGVPTEEEVELQHTGTVTTFCIVNVPFAGQAVECPYASATIRLDGADVGFYGLIQEIPVDDVRIGMRVEAVWKPEDQWGHTFENVAHWRPIRNADGSVAYAEGFEHA